MSDTEQELLDAEHDDLCPTCEGSGECGYEPWDWWHGSGVNVVTWPCTDCDGTGER